MLASLALMFMAPGALAWRQWPDPQRDDSDADRDGGDYREGRDGRDYRDGRDGRDDRDRGQPIPAQVDYRALERAVLDEMNLFRKDPRAYVAKLEAVRDAMRGNLIMREGETPIATQEGVSAVNEAIAVLSRASRRLPRFAHSNGLADAAREHADDLAQSGALGHDGTDGSSPDQRVSRHGRWVNMVAENIAFGPTTAEDIVVGLIIDDGVADRGHRDILLEGQLFFAGVACGPHPSYGTTCVIDYATGLETGPMRKPRNNWRPNMGPE
ncbi:MAG: CAP domain-containing protein [Myxococcota bacterium]